MKLSQFRFRLPDELLALEPPHKVFENPDGSTEKVYRRDECRMMIVHRKSQTIEMFEKDEEGNDTEEFIKFRSIINYFDEGDSIIFNDSKVFPARLYGTKEKTDAKIEVFLLRELNPELRLWDVLVEPARKIRIGNKLFFEEEGPMVAEVIDNTTSRGRTLRFLYDCPHEEFKQELFALGSSPVPRYIIDRRPVSEDDTENFQTIYAQHEGAVTAPASGLHFSRETPEACVPVNESKANGHHICAVGVTTLRATETAVGTDGMLKEFNGWTNKFIFPPYDFGLADRLIVNFYYSESTMLMATAAFGGYDLIMEAYQKAVDNGYHFGCYGDCMLILDD